MQVARANNIDYQPVECTHKGNCAGTCPMCEGEVSYLETQLMQRKRLGKAVSLAGIALGVSLSQIPVEADAQEAVSVLADSIAVEASKSVDVKSLLNDGETGFVMRGRIVDEANEPILGATIRRVGTDKGCITDLDGIFAIEICNGCQLEVSFIGYENFEFTADEAKPNVEVKLADGPMLQGEVIAVGGVGNKPIVDDVYFHGGK